MKKSTNIIYWLPRILCILFILFISLFALDAFQSELTLTQQIVAFLIHLIPSFILIATLIIAWKWEFIGGIMFTLIGIGFSPSIFMHNYKMNQSIWITTGIISSITLPFVIIGILFIVSHYQKKKYLT